MSHTTIIKRVELTDRIFAIVITHFFLDGSMKALFHVYKEHGYSKEDDRSLTLEHSERWSTEAGAIQAMRLWIDENTSATGAYIGSI